MCSCRFPRDPCTLYCCSGQAWMPSTKGAPRRAKPPGIKEWAMLVIAALGAVTCSRTKKQTTWRETAQHITAPHSKY